MLITERFVFVHLPKTGGTFVADAVSMLYGGFQFGRAVDFAAKRPPANQPFCFRNQFKHLSRQRTPEPFRYLPLLATVRNPYSRYVSQYRFGTWKVESKAFPHLAAHPAFPDVPFGDFVRLSNDALWLISNPDFYRARSLGWQTASVVQWCGFPDRLVESLTDAEFTVESMHRLLHPITLLRMEHLREDLYQTLVMLGYERDKLGFLHQLPKIYPESPSSGLASSEHDAVHDGDDGNVHAIGRSYTPMATHSDPPWQDYYDQELQQYVRDKERLLFEMFPEWDDR